MGAQLDGGAGGAEHLGSFGDAEALVLDQFERDALGLRQLCQHLLNAFDELSRLEQLIASRLLGLALVRLAVGGEHFAPPAPHAVYQEAPSNGEGPRRDLGAGDETIARAVDVEHGLLQEVLGTRGLTRLSKEVPVQPRGERVVHGRKGGIVPFRVALHGHVG